MVCKLRSRAKPWTNNTGPKPTFFHRGADLWSACDCAIVSNFVLVRADFMLLSEGVIPRPSMHENFVDRQWECWLRENCPPNP